MEPLFVDIHSHAVPSGDDGAQSAAEGIALCRDAAAHGTRVLFATPHVFAHLPLTEERERAVRAARDAIRGQRELGRRFVEDGTATLVASDGHRATRPARLDEAYELVKARVGEERTLPLFDGSALGLAATPVVPRRAASAK